MRTLKLSLFIVCVCFFQILKAQQTYDTLNTNILDEVIISATKTLRQLSTLPLPAKLISKEEIIKSNSSSLTEILDDQIGIYEYHMGAVNKGGMATENQTFTGIYQVVKVDSKFNNGQFLQTLHLVRMNQQQGPAAETLETSITKVYGSSDKNTTTIKPGSSNPRKPGGNDRISTSSVASKVSNAVKTGGIEVTLSDGRVIYKKKRGQ